MAARGEIVSFVGRLEPSARADSPRPVPAASGLARGLYPTYGTALEFGRSFLSRFGIKAEHRCQTRRAGHRSR